MTLSAEEVRAYLAQTAFRCATCSKPARPIGFRYEDRRVVRVRVRCHGQDELVFMSINEVEDCAPQVAFLAEQPIHEGV